MGTAAAVLVIGTPTYRATAIQGHNAGVHLHMRSSQRTRAAQITGSNNNNNNRRDEMERETRLLAMMIFSSKIFLLDKTLSVGPPPALLPCSWR